MTTMRLPIFQIDAFTTQVFQGNYAAVVPLKAWLPTALMQAIATENNLSETAFYVEREAGEFEIRWFSPLKEIDFCGHATLASAFVIFQANANPHANHQAIRFHAAAVGELLVNRLDQGLMEMSFPSRKPMPLDAVPAPLIEGLSIRPHQVLRSQQAYFAIYESEDEVRAVVPRSAPLIQLAPFDVVVTAPGVEHDFVSRYFWPANGGDEDPVTGSIHAGLAPYWSERLGKTDLNAFQASTRGGVLRCRVAGDRVWISGSAVQYLEGTITVPVPDV